MLQHHWPRPPHLPVLLCVPWLPLSAVNSNSSAPRHPATQVCVAKFLEQPELAASPRPASSCPSFVSVMNVGQQLNLAMFLSNAASPTPRPPQVRLHVTPCMTTYPGCIKYPTVKTETARRPRIREVPLPSPWIRQVREYHYLPRRPCTTTVTRTETGKSEDPSTMTPSIPLDRQGGSRTLTRFR
ncbi:hypothetical protein TRIUR3_08460 [Triticum urartu]|uniref:Uncharacterized protein n=1 Tax=Triticum urartu TaxID=4572 RepID=M7Z334_TRIUA|nr:hypothetical protein TRIUR3_08460 [Triticum urartu]